MNDVIAESKSYQDAIKGEKITKNGGGAQALTDGDEEILDRVWAEIAAEDGKKPKK